MAHGTAAPDEIARFEAMAEAWWDPRGKFRPLHQINPPRLAFVRDAAALRFGRDARSGRPFEGLSALDIGCGGGLLSEPLARLGFAVTGIDASARNVEIAGRHAAAVGLEIAYRNELPEALAATGVHFDLVLNMEVIEHVADRDAFMAACCRLVGPGGAMAASTINRTVKALALAKIGAEYVLRWLPAGTHDWRKFVKPSELARALRAGGMRVTKMAGLGYDPMTDEWRLVRDFDVNYLVFAVKD